MKHFPVNTSDISHLIYYDESIVLVYSNLFQFKRMSLAEVFEVLPLSIIESINAFRFGRDQ